MATSRSAGVRPIPGVGAERTRELLSNLVESTQDAIVTKDRTGTITSWNEGAAALYGYSAEEAIGSPISIIEAPELQAEQRSIARRVFAGESFRRLEAEQIHRDQRRISVSLTVSPVRDSDGRVVLASIIAHDITDRKRYQERLQFMADHDQLTGLLNRRRFEEELKRELARTGRNHSSGAVLSIDIDNFKSINDAAGHSAGDAVLVEVARVLRGRFRATDALARMGGDEFCVLLTDLSAERARVAAYDVLAAIDSACRPMFGGRLLRVEASVGVAPFESDDATSSEVIVHADLAMYAAKSSGRHGVVVYSAREGQRVRGMMRQPWVERIRDALDRDRFVLHYQPILDLASGQLSHGELLLRMCDDLGNVIAPAAFLPIAERQGLIRHVDRWVIEHAIELIGDADRSPPAPVGINLSGDSLAADPDLLPVIERALSRTGVDPGLLIFEVTETAAIANMPEAARFASALRSLGCSLALDDFGTGFGSFYYLKHLPVGYLKLDGEFIHNLPYSRVDEHVVRSIVSIARALGIKTVAESVSNAETIRLLQDHGVDYAQGFYVGRPEPVAE